MDLFASRLNCQTETYISWKPDPFALAVDAFTMNWNTLGTVYAFPPFALISKMLKKIVLDKVEKAIIVVPYWTTQPWFSRIGKLLIDCPFLLPRKQDSMTHPWRKTPHDLDSKLQLMVCCVSGVTYKPMAFQRERQISSCRHGNRKHKNSMCATSNDGYSFAVNQVWISCHRM